MTHTTHYATNISTFSTPKIKSMIECALDLPSDKYSAVEHVEYSVFTGMLNSKEDGHPCVIPLGDDKAVTPVTVIKFVYSTAKGTWVECFYSHN